MVPLCWPLRKLIGRGAAFAAAVLFAFGPSYLYFSRFAREDIYVAAITLALLVVIWRFLEKPRKFYPALIGLCLALLLRDQGDDVHHGLRDGLVLPRRARDPAPGARRSGAGARPPGWEGWGWFLAAFAGLFTLLFTTFLTHPGGLWDGIYTGLEYWLEPARRRAAAASPPSSTSTLLVTIEWPVLILGAIGAVALWRRWPIFAAFLVWDFVVSLIVYSWAGEKFAWLVLHPLLPADPARRRGHRGDRADRAARCAGSGIAGRRRSASSTSASRSWWVNVDRGTDPREMLVSTQSSEQVKEVADQVLALAASRGPGAPPLTRHGGLRRGRDLPLRLVLPPPADGLHRPPAGQRRRADLRRDRDDREQPRPAQPAARRATTAAMFDFRVWWVREYGSCGISTRRTPAGTSANWFNYVTQREVWNPTGGMREWLYIKKAP